MPASILKEREGRWGGPALRRGHLRSVLRAPGMEMRTTTHRMSVMPRVVGIGAAAFLQWRAGTIIGSGDGEVLQRHGVEGNVRHRWIFNGDGGFDFGEGGMKSGHHSANKGRGCHEGSLQEVLVMGKESG
jgi:hypothetical protein